MPTNDGFNGSTFEFGGVAHGNVRSLDVTIGGATVDVSASGDGTAGKTWVNGLDDIEIGIEFVAGMTTAITRGAIGTLGISWNDSSTTGTGAALTDAICTQITQRGSMDGEITANATFKKTPT
jgi:hypothetical protein